MAFHSNALVFPGPAAPPNSRYFAFDSWNSRCRGNGLYSSEIRRSSRAVADARMGGASCQRSVFNRASGERPTDDGLFPIARGAFCRQKTPRPRRQKTRRWRSGGSSALRPPQTPRCRPVAPIARPLEDEDSLPCALRNSEAAPRKGRVTAASVFLLTFVFLSTLAADRRISLERLSREILRFAQDDTYGPGVIPRSEATRNLLFSWHFDEKQMPRCARNDSQEQ